MRNLPLLIFKETFLLQRIQGHREFRPQDNSIVFIKEGFMELWVDGMVRKYAADNILFISPRKIYETRKISEDIKLFVVAITPEYRKYISYSFNRFDMYRAITVEQNSAIEMPAMDFHYLWGILEHIFYQAQAREASQYINEIILHSYSAIAYSIASSLEQLAQTSKEPNSRKETLTMSFIELAFNNFIQQKELKFYADSLFISVKYLSICVKDVTGYPPTYLLNLFLLDAAAGFLADRNNSVADVADKLEFADQFSFSKFFRKNMKVTPSAFRKKIMQVHTI